MNFLNVLNPNYYCNTTRQFVFVCFAMYMARPLLKLKHSALLVMYSWLKGEMNSKYITLLFFNTNNVLVTKAMPIGFIHSKCHTEKQ